MTDIVVRLRNGEAWPNGESQMRKEVATEIARLQAGLMKAMQYENKCDQTGKPCSDLCGCRLEAETWYED